MTYQTRGTCSRFIEVELDGETIREVTFIGGCSGNTQGVAKLVKGQNARQVIDLLEGTDCAGRGTSCPDQLAKALRLALEEQKSAQKRAMGTCPHGSFWVGGPVPTALWLLMDRPHLKGRTRTSLSFL